MKAVIYARTATTDQTRAGVKIKTQINACLKYANENGYDVREVFADPGFSGIGLNRPGLRALRKPIARDASIRAVIAYDSARLSRSLAQLKLLQTERSAGSVQLHLRGSPVSSKLLRQLWRRTTP